MKIKELKNNVKVIREVKRESEGDKEINELTEDELPFSGSEISRATGFRLEGSQVARVGGAEMTRAGSQRDDNSSASTVRLYDVGKSMSGEAGESKYHLAETIHSENMRTVGVGRDFAMGQSSGDYPEANRIESSLRQEDEKKYATDMNSAGGKKGKRYAWEG